MNRLFLVLLLLGARASPLAALQDSLPLELTHLGLDLRLDYQRSALSGSSTLVVWNHSGRAVPAVPLLLNRLMQVRRVTDARGRTIPFRQQIAVFRDDSIRQVNAVTVARSVRQQDSIGLTIFYDGFLVGYTETGSLYIKDRIDSAFTILREDAYAFPVLGGLSDKTNRTIARKPFSFSARITVPAGEIVATGGVLDSTVRHDSLVSWSYSSRVAVPFLNLAIAPYARLTSGATTLFHFPADSEGARRLGEAVNAALARFGQWYGELPSAPHLVIMEIPEGMGSQASLTGGIIQTADAFRERSELPQLYHELSHLWNVPDLEQPSARWNEGLASFLQWRMAAELDGWNDWTGRLERTRQRVLRQCAASGNCGTAPFATYGRSGDTDRSYGVGMLMFYALWKTMGGERFDRAYRDFFQQYRNHGGSISNLIGAFEREDPASGVIFREWLTTARWYERLSAGEQLDSIIGGYTHR